MIAPLVLDGPDQCRYRAKDPIRIGEPATAAALHIFHQFDRILAIRFNQLEAVLR